MSTPTDAQIQEATKLYQSLLSDGYRDGQGITDLVKLIAARDENRELKKDKERLDFLDKLTDSYLCCRTTFTSNFYISLSNREKFSGEAVRQAIDAAISAGINSVKNI